MKKINNILFLLSFAFMFVFLSCSDSDDFAQEVGNMLSYTDMRNTISMPLVVHEENWEGNSDLLSKSSLTYKYKTGRMLFEWHVGDKVGVYPVKYLDGKGVQQTHLPENSAVTEWEIFSVTTTTDKSVGVFDTDDEHIASHRGESYIAVSPYILDDTDYRDIVISYEGQTQKESAKIGSYMKRATPAEEEKYEESEAAACRHLADYDYLVDKERAATEDGGKIRFQMKRLGSIVRFYLKVPEKLVYDSLQLYNPSKEFTLKTTLDAAEGEFAAVPTKKSHVTSLRLHDFGFDYTTCTANDDYYLNPSIGWIMLCYMMVAPIDLSAAETEQSTLYLLGRSPKYYTTLKEYNDDHEPDIDADAFAALTQERKMKVYTSYTDFNTAKGLTGDDALTEEEFNALTTAQKMKDGERKYYKATLAKKNLQADILYQWSTAGLEEDDPITFEEITIQEWKEGINYTNTDGAGTGDW